MLTSLRVLGAAVAGLAIAFALVVAVEAFSAIVHPFPAGFAGSQEEICAHVAEYPAGVLGAIVPMWAAIAFVGTWLAGWLGNRVGAAVVAALLLAAAVLNLAMLPYPTWYKVVQPVAILLAIAVAFRAVAPRSPPSCPAPGPA